MMKTARTALPGRRRRVWKWLTAIPPLLIVIGLADVAVESNTVRVNEIVVRDPDVPPGFRGFRIAFLSDIHHGPFFPKARLRDLVKQVNGLKPDLVLLGGDYIHHGVKYITTCFEELGRLKAPHGVFAVLGNHDHWGSAPLCREGLERNGIGLIDNEAVWLHRGREKIKVGGVGDLLCDIQVLSPLIRDSAEGDFVVLVSHNPDYAENISTRKIDLMLSGHTHGGQVTLFGLYAPLLPTRTGQKYRSGVVDAPLLKVIVSNGIGVISPPVRFGAPAEIVLIELREAGDKKQSD